MEKPDSGAGCIFVRGVVELIGVSTPELDVMELILAALIHNRRDQNNISKRIVSLLEKNIKGKDETIHAYQTGASIVISVNNNKTYTDQHIQDTKTFSCACRGYFSKTPLSAENLLSSITFIDGSPHVAESPGGIYSVILADKRYRKIFAWSSHGHMEGMFHSQCKDFTACCSNPLVVHLLTQPNFRPYMDEQWCRNVIVPSSTLYNDTPFFGTSYIPARQCLVISDGGVSFAPHPIHLSLHDRQDPTDRLMAEGQRAVSVALNYPQATIKLSGGKDSRAALALLHSIGAVVKSETSGRESGGEARAARAMAEALDIDHVTVQNAHTGARDFWPTVNANLRRADGLLSENRHLIHRLSENSTVEIHGQAHHPRGGYMTKNRYRDIDEVRSAIIRRFTGGATFCRDDLKSDVERRVDDFIKTVHADSPGLHLYWVYNDLRIPRWLQAAFHALRKSKLLIWPFLDERFLQACANLSTYDRSMETAHYMMIARGAPKIAGIPLYKSTWRFDNRGADIFPQWRKSRGTPLEDSPELSSGAKGVASTIERLYPYLREALSDFKAGPLVLDLVHPKYRKYLMDGRLDSMIQVQGRFPLYIFMWRLLAILAVHEGEWIESSRIIRPLQLKQI